MIGPASIRFRAGIGGEPVLEDLQRSDVATFQPTDWGSWMITSASHPVPGDRYSVRVTVGVGCCAEIRSLGTTVAHRDPSQPVGAATESSTAGVHAGVASDGLLVWAPEPGLSVEGCDHHSEAVVQLSGSARLLWRDEFMVDRRSDGEPGTWSSRLRVTRDGWPVVSTETAIGPATPLWESPAVLGGARAVSSMVVVDPGRGLAEWSSARATVGSATGVALPLSVPGVQIMAWGQDLRECRAAIKAMVKTCGVPTWVLERWEVRRAFEGAAPAAPPSPVALGAPSGAFGMPGPAGPGPALPALGLPRLGSPAAAPGHGFTGHGFTGAGFPGVAAMPQGPGSAGFVAATGALPPASLMPPAFVAAGPGATAPGTGVGVGRPGSPGEELGAGFGGAGADEAGAVRP